MKLRVLGMDPSMRNWGICSAIVYSDELEKIRVTAIDLIHTEKTKNKSIRTNCADLDTAKELADVLIPLPQAHAVFCETPVGSQSSAAMKSYGMCLGLLGVMQSQSNNIITVSAESIKVFLCDNKKASKHDVINAVYEIFPNLDWPTKRDGSLVTTKAEHIADAIGAVMVGVHTDEFKQLVNSINLLRDTVI